MFEESKDEAKFIFCNAFDIIYLFLHIKCCYCCHGFNVIGNHSVIAVNIVSIIVIAFSSSILLFFLGNEKHTHTLSY